MNLREIRIGRDPRCEILLDQRCNCASRIHAIIYMDGHNLMLRDNSSNGTMVNNIMVRHRAVAIHYNDSIMIAGKYPISWRQITQYFPNAGSEPQPQQPYSYGQNMGYQQPYSQGYAQNSGVNQGADWNGGGMVRDTPNLSKFNFGAFVLYPIWGFFNGCWWAFLIWLVFGWTLVPSFVFGICGTRWSWDNGSWTSARDFEESQHSWMVAGIIVFCLDILAWILFYAFFFSLYMSLVSVFL